MPSSTPSLPSPQVTHMALFAWVLGALTLGLLAILTVQFQSRAVADRYSYQSDTTGAQEIRPNPFRIAGCISFQAFQQGGCQQLSSTLLPHAADLRTKLGIYVRPTRSNSPNTVYAANGDLAAGGDHATPIKQGRNLSLTLDALWSLRAQTTARCYTGDRAACTECPWCGAVEAGDMYEDAKTRAMGILIVNARTSAIEAAASAYTPCFEQMNSGQAPGAACPDLPNTPAKRPQKLGSQAIDQQAAPGSITKIIIFLGLQRAGLSFAEEAQMPSILAKSETLPLIDIVFCKSAHFDTACAAKRVNAIATVAAELRWNGKPVDVLSQGQSADLYAPRFAARFMHRADGAIMQFDARISTPALAACSARQWKACDGPLLGALVSEFFGTGDAMASPVGVANVLLALHASASAGQPRQAHLIAAAQDAAPTAAYGEATTTLPPRAHAAKLLRDLEGGIEFGSAYSACAQAAKALPGGNLPCAVHGKSQGLRIMGKTGTTVFSADVDRNTSIPLFVWTARCRKSAQQLQSLPATDRHRYLLQNEVNKCNMSPNKWYGALVTDPQTGQTYVIVALAERNWSRRTQLIQGHNEVEANIAAEATLSLVNAMFHPTLQHRPAPTLHALGAAP